MAPPKLYVVLPDEHHDEPVNGVGSNDPRFWRAKLDFISDVSPTGVIAEGDFTEGASGSAHVPDAFKPAYDSDCNAMQRAWREVREAAGARTALTLMEGNHENAILRCLTENQPSMVQGFWRRFARDTGMEDNGVKFVPEAQNVRLGAAMLKHGHQWGKRGFPKHHAYNVGLKWGAPGIKVVVGHSHRPGHAVIANQHGDWECFMLGAGRNLVAPWLKGEREGWANEFAVIKVWHDGTTIVDPIRWDGQRFVYGDRVYTGR